MAITLTRNDLDQSENAYIEEVKNNHYKFDLDEYNVYRHNLYRDVPRGLCVNNKRLDELFEEEYHRKWLWPDNIADGPDLDKLLKKYLNINDVQLELLKKYYTQQVAYLTKSPVQMEYLEMGKSMRFLDKKAPDFAIHLLPAENNRLQTRTVCPFAGVWDINNDDLYHLDATITSNTSLNLNVDGPFEQEDIVIQAGTQAEEEHLRSCYMGDKQAIQGFSFPKISFTEALQYHPVDYSGLKVNNDQRNTFYEDASFASLTDFLDKMYEHYGKPEDLEMYELEKRAIAELYPEDPSRATMQPVFHSPSPSPNAQINFRAAIMATIDALQRNEFGVSGRAYSSSDDENDYLDNYNSDDDSDDNDNPPVPTFGHAAPAA